MESHKAKRIVALSSTSMLSKKNSADLRERVIAGQLATGEQALTKWADAKQVQCIILRPSLIYDFNGDKNISVIASFINKFGFFPLVGQGSGLRQPIHAFDVAQACQNAMTATVLTKPTYEISGGETLTYREMVERIFVAMRRPPRFLVLPIWIFRVAIFLARVLPRYRNLSSAMAERMEFDLVFDHQPAASDLNFYPHSFKPLQKINTMNSEPDMDAWKIYILLDKYLLLYKKA